MGRRSDHSRAELEALILAEGHRLMAEVGYARFSAREVAKRIGYSIGTIHNVFGSHNRLVMAINSHTFTLWAEAMRARLDAGPADRIAVLVESYFSFAAENPNLWMAIYDHRLPEGEQIPERDREQRAGLTGMVEAEIIRVLPPERAGRAAALARSLVATVHGHCAFALTGTFALLGEEDPMGAALARVRETLAAAGG
ncbi:TetR/AcrR family transcriptional regulator [Sphingomonas sp. LB-2]|uniref:TetR/AcrR family transcriptional regulator n=1 Tax=Sphingomonas caeni TaxID=2984949 RepID=UPI00223013B0|nr:TetR/AcrR family transcriptional regulator [Sphingomonas caeni]MCW3846317.1 TetR/AcrR family transcriptional regulator [Sphingomonas caeni]